MNQEKIDKLKGKAKQSLKILEMVESGATPQQIVEKLGVNRQLVDYYINVANQV